MISLGLWVVEREITEVNGILIKSYQRYKLVTWLITFAVDLDPLPRWSLSDFTLQLLLCSHFLHCVLWKEVIILSQHLRSGSYVPPHWVESLYGVILHGRFVYCLTFIYLFNNVFISVWTYGYLFCIWGYNSILICLFCCSNCFTFGH